MRPLLAALIVLALTPVAQAAAPAFDHADDPDYADGWQAGDAGGTGWSGVWGISTGGSGAGAFVGSSTTNGDGDDDMDGDIDSPSGQALGLFVEENGAAVLATRFFDGALVVGDQVSMDFDNDPAGGEPGFRLVSGGQIRFTFRYSPTLLGTGSYQIKDQAGFVALGIPGTDEGVHVAFTLTGADEYLLAVTPAGASTFFREGTLDLAGPITSLTLRMGGEEDTRREAFYNNLKVGRDPAPTLPLAFWLTSGLLLLGVALYAGGRASAVSSQGDAGDGTGRYS